MGRYYTQALKAEHEQMIKYYADYGRPGSALHQAEWHWRQLGDLKARAYSRGQHADVQPLQEIMDRAAEWMDKAAGRDKTYGDQNG